VWGLASYWPGLNASAASPKTPAAAAQSEETAQRFLASAQQSVTAQDYELAALQFHKAVEELQAANASANEIDQVKLKLAGARLREGKLELAYAVCGELLGGTQKAQARALGGEIRKAFRKEGEALLASGRQDLQAGRLTPALEKARQAEKIMISYNGSADQINRARALLASARKVEGGLGLSRTRSKAPQQVGNDVERRQPAGGRRAASSGASAYPQYRAPQSESRGEGEVLAGSQSRSRQTSQASAQSMPTDSPMERAMRGGRRPASTSQQSQPQQAEGEAAPESAPQEEGQQQSGGYSAPVSFPTGSHGSSRRSRAGSTDVLPTYSSQGGGSAY
jgi:hypothetical protein